MAFIQNDHALGSCRFIHVMGDQHNGNIFIVIKLFDRIHYFPAAFGIKHRSGFVQYDTLRFHCDHTGDGNALLLSAGQKMGRVTAVLLHTYLLQRIIHPVTDCRCSNAQILRAKCHIFFNHIGDDLIIGILEYHTNGFPNGYQFIRI